MAGTPPPAAAASGGASPRIIPVWDPLVRLIHWSLALVILLNGFVTDPEGDLHETLGYAALALVLTRLCWGLIGPHPARLISFPPSPARALRHVRHLRAGDDRVHLTHNPLGALMVWNIWATVLLVTTTGIMMGTRRFFGVSWVEDMHEILFNWLLVSVILHIGGVVFETWHSGVPLVRAMIDGKKRIPADRPIE